MSDAPLKSCINLLGSRIRVNPRRGLDVRYQKNNMIYYAIKIVITTLLIVAVSEIAKRYSLMAGILASLPLVSILAMIWLYIDTKDIEKIIHLSKSIFWMVLPSLALFISLPILLKLRVTFYLSMLLSCFVMFVCYYGMTIVLRK